MVPEIDDEIIEQIQEAETPYEVLGLAQNCTKREIRIAYLNISKKVHPDHCKHPDATDCMQRVNAAYNLLKDDEKRKRYDDGDDHVWMYKEEKIDLPQFFEYIIPSVRSFEDDISPEEVLNTLFQNVNDVKKSYENRKFFTGKAPKTKKKEKSEGFVKEHILQTICYLIPLGLSYFLLSRFF
ncbi:DnaJ-like subfamily B member 12 [Histomonas meleagridis]|uniref:DnaJ-like subfamily B member 12 n=1 Tax=Histomonas meleagridis TaxID=135588 RepID=UPI003559B1FD|nr:DnaJ-like subfamily B member 12 [Histomonas meleagridis]KAH0804628.1 DnaJ-like subfamily B member 12 [Histomonas meleagridis]